MSIVHSARYRLDLGPHVWPTEKYDLIRRRLVEDGVVGPEDFVEPEPAPWADLALVHTSEYLEKARSNRFREDDILALELPFSPAVTEGFRVMTGGTERAAQLALAHGTGIHLGGGLHHAFADHGEGFCLFNDVAVSIRVLQRDGHVRKAAVVDCDVHHGNGTASIFSGDPSVFTFSIHQQANYPAFKPPSDLDIGLPDGAGDVRYLHELERALPTVLESGPQVVYYLAGADPYREDQLGGLALTLDGLRRRDRMVLDATAGIPLVVVLAGGYARKVDDTVAIHAATVVEALARPKG